jgi:hypothetical protein
MGAVSLQATNITITSPAAMELGAVTLRVAAFQAEALVDPRTVTSALIAEGIKDAASRTPPEQR